MVVMAGRPSARPRTRTNSGFARVVSGRIIRVGPTCGYFFGNARITPGHWSALSIRVRASVGYLAWRLGLARTKHYATEQTGAAKAKSKASKIQITGKA